MVTQISQVEEIARRVVQEQVGILRRDLLREMREREHRQSERQMERVWEAIHALAQAQARTEQRVEELAQAQARTEQRVEELAQAQARTEERLTRLEAAVERLAEAQARTEEAVSQLFRQVGHLANLMGADLEVDAEELLLYVMEQKGYRSLGPAYPILVDGEIDVALPVESPQGERLWALVEAKARVRQKELGRWAKRLKDAEFLRRLAEARIEKPYLPYIFGLRIYPQVIAAAEKAGIGVLDFRGERVEATPLS